MDPGALTSKAPNRPVVNITNETDQAELKVLLQACIKLLRNKKVVENLETLIDNCIEKDQPHVEKKVVNKIHNNKRRTGQEMRLTAQIGDFEMD